MAQILGFRSKSAGESPALDLYGAGNANGMTFEMASWFITEFRAREADAHESVRDMMKDGPTWSAPAGASAAEREELKAQIDAFVKRTADATAAAYNKQLVNVLIQLWIARHPPA